MARYAVAAASAILAVATALVIVSQQPSTSLNDASKNTASARCPEQCTSCAATRCLTCTSGHSIKGTACVQDSYIIVAQSLAEDDVPANIRALDIASELKAQQKGARVTLYGRDSCASASIRQRAQEFGVAVSCSADSPLPSLLDSSRSQTKAVFMFQWFWGSSPSIPETMSSTVRMHAPEARLVVLSDDFLSKRERMLYFATGQAPELSSAFPQYDGTPGRQHVRQTATRESKGFAQADLVITTSSADRNAILTDGSAKTPVDVIHWSHGLTGAPQPALSSLPSFAERDGLVFLGHGASPLNVISMHWFMSRVFPRVESTMASMGLPTPPVYLVGHAAGAFVDVLRKAAPQADIRVVADVQSNADIMEFMQERKLSVVPSVAASGVSTKLWFSASSGVPVIASKHSVAGFRTHAVSSRFLASAFGAFSESQIEEFAQQLVTLYTEPEAWANALRMSEEFISKTTAAQTLSADVERITKRLETIAVAHVGASKRPVFSGAHRVSSMRRGFHIMSGTGTGTGTATAAPTATPTATPTASPTETPTLSPTLSPTASPTLSPTASPTLSPTASPTLTPTTSPTAAPTPAPTPATSDFLIATPGALVFESRDPCLNATTKTVGLTSQLTTGVVQVNASLADTSGAFAITGSTSLTGVSLASAGSVTVSFTPPSTVGTVSATLVLTWTSGSFSGQLNVTVTGVVANTNECASNPCNSLVTCTDNFPSCGVTCGACPTGYARANNGVGPTGCVPNAAGIVSAPTIVQGSATTFNLSWTFVGTAGESYTWTVEYITQTDIDLGLTAYSNASTTVATAAGATSASLSLTVGATYPPDTTYIFRARAVGSAGNTIPLTGNPPGTKFALLSVPPAPTLTGTATSAGVGQHSVQLSWSTPGTRGQPLSSFTLYVGNTVLFSGLATTYTHTGLVTATAYSYTISATNALATGANSTVLTVTTLTDPPGVVNALTLTATGTTTATASWTVPTGATGTLTYRTELSVSGTNTYSTVSESTATSVSLTALTPGTAYVVRVSARFAASDYGASVVSSAATTTGAPPQAPPAPVVTGVTANTITVTVLTVVGHDLRNGQAITGYTVSATGGGSTLTTTVAAGATLTGVQITGAAAYTVYSVSVVATNAAGNSASSVAVSQRTAAGTPSAPTLSIQSRTDTAVTVSWLAQTVVQLGGLSSATYTVTVNNVSSVTTLNSLTVTGLTANTNYTITVAVSNGFASNSATIATTTLLSPPELSSFVASGASNPLFSDGDVFTFTFSSATNQPAVSTAAQVLAIFSFSNFGFSSSTSFTGTWNSSTVLTLSFQTVAGISPVPVIGGTSVTFVSGNSLTNAAGTSASARGSRSLTGNFGPPASSTYASALTFSASILNTAEDTATSFSLTWTDTVGSASSDQLTVVLSAGQGTLTLNGVTNATQTVTGTEAQIKAALNGQNVTYTPSANYAGSDAVQAVLTVVSTSQVGFVQSLPITVTAVNDAPVITTSATTFTLDVLTQASGFSLGNITVSDVDAGSANVQLSITAVSASGRITLPTVTGVSYAPAATAPSSVFTVIGSLANINTVLSGMTYSTTAVKASLVETVSIVVSDLGNTGGSAQTASAVLTINTVLNCLSSTAAPVLSSAKLADSVSSVDFTFDRPIFVANSAAGVNCSTVFVNSASLLGTGALCYVIPDASQNPTILRAFLQNGATVAPASTVSLQGTSGVRRCSTSSNEATGSVAVAQPDNPAAPTAQISGPVLIGPCDDLSLASFASATYGRSAQYLWSVTGGLAADTPLSGVTSSTPRFTVSSFRMSAGQTYTFRLQVRNFLGAVSAAVTKVVTKSASPVPQLSITGGTSLQTDVNSLLRVSVNAARSQCVTQDSALNFAWTISPAPVTAPTNTNASSLALIGGSLSVGTVYTLTCRASKATDATVFNQVTATVTAVARPLIAVVAGETRSLGSARPLSLDASASSDPSGLTGSLSYAWTCVTATGAACVRSDGTAITIAAAASPTIAANTFSPGVYTFTVTVSKDSRSSTASSVVTITASAPPTVSVSAVSTRVADNGALKLTGSFTAPTGQTIGSLTYAWTVISGTINIAGLDLTGTRTQTDTTLQSGGVNLVINEAEATAFVAGTTVTLQLAVTGSDGLVGFSSITITILAPPALGSFSAAATNGAATSAWTADLSFTLSCPQWENPSGNSLGPLTYRYYRRAAGGVPSFISGVTASTQYTTSFLTQGTYFLGCRVTSPDQLFTDAEVSYSIGAPAIAVTQETLAEDLNSAVTSSTEEGQSGPVVAVSASVSESAAAGTLDSETGRNLVQLIIDAVAALSAREDPDTVMAAMGDITNTASALSSTALNSALRGLLQSLNNGFGPGRKRFNRRNARQALRSFGNLLGAGRSSNSFARRLLATLDASQAFSVYAAVNDTFKQTAENVLDLPGETQDLSVVSLQSKISRFSPITVSGASVSIATSSRTSTYKLGASPVTGAVGAGDYVDVAITSNGNNPLAFLAPLTGATLVTPVVTYSVTRLSASTSQSLLTPLSSSATLTLTCDALTQQVCACRRYYWNTSEWVTVASAAAYAATGTSTVECSVGTQTYGVIAGVGIALSNQAANTYATVDLTLSGSVVSSDTATLKTELAAALAPFRSDRLTVSILSTSTASSVVRVAIAPGFDGERTGAQAAAILDAQAVDSTSTLRSGTVGSRVTAASSTTGLSQCTDGSYQAVCPDDSDDDLSDGAIAGIVIVVIFVVFTVAYFVYRWWSERKTVEDHTEDPDEVEFTAVGGAEVGAAAGSRGAVTTGPVVTPPTRADDYETGEMEAPPAFMAMPDLELSETGRDDDDDDN